MAQEDPLSFADDPRADLDRALDDLVDRAKDVLTTQGRLRALLRANQAVTEHLELPVVLRTIVEAAVELVGAQYGALGVIAPDGSLEQFINVGMSPHQVEDIGQLPSGHGLLGALIDDPHVIRLEELSDDPRSAGFPAHHPSMSSFLGVPVRVRDEVFGNLYLTNHSSGKFSRDDEQLVASLAATAGVAIDNARLYAQTQRRHAWSAASAEITSAMLSAVESEAVAMLASRVLDLSGADLVTVVVPGTDPDEVIVTVARGIDEDQLEGRHFPANETLAGSVLAGGHPRLVHDGNGSATTLSDGRMLGPIMALPIISATRTEGVLLVCKLADGQRFTSDDLEMAADFAGQASVALELVKARAAQQRVLMLEDRGRIARDLHDHVIQQLFGTGLELQSIAGSLGSPDVGRRVLDSVANLDAAISQIRTIIFALTSTGSEQRESVRHQLIDLANDVSSGTTRIPTVAFSGPVDLVVTGDLAKDIIAVARESLTNATKHAGATSTSVTVAVDGSSVEVVVTDDGSGIANTGRRSGLANLELRATSRGGTFTIDSSSAGTTITWTVPIPASDEETT
ncbi:GAF domain-containing protein [Glaciihabitans sp. UYNi722]|uniref:GAF domain-containing sensor histidine kinase n=1 Tax=Glaciihabitans sp. UYNi722 TaxID=3156344 RepID=UPI0033909370